MTRDFSLRTEHGTLPGRLALPKATTSGLVILGYLHTAPDQDILAASLQSRDQAVLSISLLTGQELHSGDAPYNVSLLAQRLLSVFDLVQHDGDTEALPVGVFAAGHVTPAAIRAAARRDQLVRALACHGGLVDLAGIQNLELLTAPLLMVTDADDDAAATSFTRAASHLSAMHQFCRLGPGETAGPLVAGWFSTCLQAL